MLYIYSLPAAASVGWDTRGNTLTLSAGGLVNGVQLAGETHLTPVHSIFDQVIDVRTSGVDNFDTIATILQRASEGKNFREFITEPAQQERSDSDPEQDEEDVCLSTILDHSLPVCMYTIVRP